MPPVKASEKGQAFICLPRSRTIGSAPEAHGIQMHPIPHDVASRSHIGVPSQNVFRLLSEIEIVEMLAANPFPDDIALPGDLADDLVQQILTIRYRSNRQRITCGD